MYVAFTGTDHKINIASSTDGQHYSGQYVPNSNWFSGHKPALGAGAGQLWLAWQGDDGGLYTASSTNGTSWTMGPTTPAQTSAAGTSQVAYPPTLASADVSTVPWVVLTWSQVVPGNPNLLQIKMGPVSVPSPGATCRQAYVTTGAGIQGGLGYLSSERLMPWIYGARSPLISTGEAAPAAALRTPPRPRRPPVARTETPAWHRRLSVLMAMCLSHGRAPAGRISTLLSRSNSAYMADLPDAGSQPASGYFFSPWQETWINHATH
jgi:hypothetical protein